MKTTKDRIAAARRAAIDVLLHNARDRADGLPRTAAWGYPEPYTRDWMLSSLGILADGNAELKECVRRVLAALAKNQSGHGLIPGLADDPDDLGSSDTTPLFLLGLAAYRSVTGKDTFLAAAARRALRWIEYQSPDDGALVAQQPTSDWRDEQWVLGFGLFVNAIVYSALSLHGRRDRAAVLRDAMNRFTITAGVKHRHVHEGLVVRSKPYYSLWSYKVLSSERFDLVGNSLAVLSGIASRTRARVIVKWVEAECVSLRARGLLTGELPPNFFPYITPDDPDWRERYARYNQPGEYHNGGVWPFAAALYVAAIVAAGMPRLAARKLDALTEVVRPAREHAVAFGFNEWFRAQDGAPRGQDWQAWSAAMYLYAAISVETNATPFFDSVRAV